jgi:hypothetical protein
MKRLPVCTRSLVQCMAHIQFRLTCKWRGADHSVATERHRLLVNGSRSTERLVLRGAALHFNADPFQVLCTVCAGRSRAFVALKLRLRSALLLRIHSDAMVPDSADNLNNI